MPQFEAMDYGDHLGSARQRFDPKHEVILQRRIPWQVAKVVREPRPTKDENDELLYGTLSASLLI